MLIVRSEGQLPVLLRLRSRRLLEVQARRQDRVTLWSDGPQDVVSVETVKYWWREWYTRVTERSGRVWHYEPLNTQWAAAKLRDILLDIFRREGRTDV